MIPIQEDKTEMGKLISAMDQEIEAVEAYLFERFGNTGASTPDGQLVYGPISAKDEMRWGLIAGASRKPLLKCEVQTRAALICRLQDLEVALMKAVALNHESVISATRALREFHSRPLPLTGP